jgi:hypothetical protein
VTTGEKSKRWASPILISIPLLKVNPDERFVQRAIIHLKATQRWHLSAYSQ